MLPLWLCIFAPTDHVEDGSIQCLARRVAGFAAIALQPEQFPKSDFHWGLPIFRMRDGARPNSDEYPIADV
jgi:hypothetical protein